MSSPSLQHLIYLQRFKRAFLMLLLALTGWSAVVMALAVYKGGRTPDNMAWALGTTLEQGFLILVCFAAFTALDHGKLRPIAILGMTAAAFVLAAMPVFAWRNITDGIHLSPFEQMARDRLTKFAVTAFLSAGLLCLIPFILVPRMRRIGRIVQLTTILYLNVAYICTVLYIWDIDTRRIEDALAMMLIPAGACMMGMFVMHKFLSIRQPDPLTSVAPELRVKCPRCQHDQALALGESRCARCRLHISVHVEEPRCPNCQFNLHNLTRPQCPECGFHLDTEEVTSKGIRKVSES